MSPARSRAPRRRSDAVRTGPRLLAAGAVAMVLAVAALVPATRFVAVPWVVSGLSMEPTLRPGDRVLVDLWTYRHRPPLAGEVALLEGPGGTVLVKRVALPLRERAEPGTQDARTGERVWVLGDNPEASVDSRSFGPVPRDRIRGRVVWRYWPLSRSGPIR